MLPATQGGPQGRQFSSLRNLCSRGFDGRCAGTHAFAMPCRELVHSSPAMVGTWKSHYLRLDHVSKHSVVTTDLGFKPSQNHSNNISSAPSAVNQPEQHGKPFQRLWGRGRRKMKLRINYGSKLHGSCTQELWPPMVFPSDSGWPWACPAQGDSFLLHVPWRSVAWVHGRPRAAGWNLTWHVNSPIP